MSTGLSLDAEALYRELLIGVQPKSVGIGTEVDLAECHLVLCPFVIYCTVRLMLYEPVLDCSGSSVCVVPYPMLFRWS